MALSNDILTFASTHLNQQVGNGECWTLAHQAKAAAGANTSSDENYIWGVSTPFAGLIAGDIIQFERYSCIIRVDYVTDDGEGYLESSSYAPHHTAIVSSILNADRSYVEVIEQNMDGAKRVRRGRYYLRSGTYQGEMLGRTGTITITVRGDIEMYHAI
jgi:myosin tail region-interacting protein MTI1